MYMYVSGKICSSDLKSQVVDKNGGSRLTSWKYESPGSKFSVALVPIQPLASIYPSYPTLTPTLASRNHMKQLGGILKLSFFQTVGESLVHS